MSFSWASRPHLRQKGRAVLPKPDTLIPLPAAPRDEGQDSVPYPAEDRVPHRCVSSCPVTTGGRRQDPRQSPIRWPGPDHTYGRFGIADNVLPDHHPCQESRDFVAQSQCCSCLSPRFPQTGHRESSPPHPGVVPSASCTGGWRDRAPAAGRPRCSSNAGGAAETYQCIRLDSVSVVFMFLLFQAWMAKTLLVRIRIPCQSFSVPGIG